VYGFKTTRGVEHHTKCMQALSRLVPVWPPVDEILAASRKADIIKMFDRIAAQVTHTVRPVTTILTIPLKTVPKDVVLKREGSDASKHVYLPQSLEELGLKKLNQLLKGSRFRWISQTWIPLLQQFGEWRVFVVGGKIFEVITTQPQDAADNSTLSVSVLRGMWNLEELT
jgi:glutathione synthase/RimK-type ligase-like ATP-grasp enzyme